MEKLFLFVFHFLPAVWHTKKQLNDVKQFLVGKYFPFRSMDASRAKHVSIMQRVERVTLWIFYAAIKGWNLEVEMKLRAENSFVVKQRELIEKQSMESKLSYFAVEKWNSIIFCKLTLTWSSFLTRHYVSLLYDTPKCWEWKQKLRALYRENIIVSGEQTSHQSN